MTLVRRWRQKVSGVVTPSPVGPAIENDSTPSPPRPSPAVQGPLITKIVQSIDLAHLRHDRRVARVQDGRVAEPVLALLGQGDRALDVGDPDERDERHHLLVVDERVLGAGLGEQELRPCGHLHAGMTGRARPDPCRSDPC